MAASQTVRIEAELGDYLKRLAWAVPLLALSSVVLVLRTPPVMWTAMAVLFVGLLLFLLPTIASNLRAYRLGQYYLELNAIGFVERRLDHVREAKWVDCSQFEIWAESFEAVIVFDNDVMPKRRVSWITRGSTGRNQSISSGYKLDAAALCELLNAYRDRAVQGSRLPDRQPSDGVTFVDESGPGRNRLAMIFMVTALLGAALYLAYQSRVELYAYFTSGRPLAETLPLVALYVGSLVLVLAGSLFFHFGLGKTLRTLSRWLFRRPPP
tara:strand:+ start:1256 stop:2059 length:804 start_codon:yes stop_codon:yes gene_type:complete